MRKEPALLYALAAAVFALVGAYGFIGPDKIRLWEALFIAAVPLLQGLFTRQEVMPLATINEAGLTSTAVHELANNEDVIPVREGDNVPAA